MLLMELQETLQLNLSHASGVVQVSKDLDPTLFKERSLCYLDSSPSLLALP